MKKFFAIISIIAIAMSVTACSKFECDLCGDEKTGRKYETSFGAEICKDCYEELEELEDSLKELGKAFK